MRCSALLFHELGREGQRAETEVLETPVDAVGIFPSPAPPRSRTPLRFLNLGRSCVPGSEMEVAAASTCPRWSPIRCSSSLSNVLSLPQMRTRGRRASSPISCHFACRTDRPFLGPAGIPTTGSFGCLANVVAAPPIRRAAIFSCGGFSSSADDDEKEFDRPLRDFASLYQSEQFGEEVAGDDGDNSSEIGCCSAKKAFSSLVFIIRELQSCTLQLRELLFCVDLRGIVARVHGDMQASFCWLFHQIFSCTPSLMLSLMLLLANFIVYSMAAHRNASAITPPVVSPLAQIVHSYQTIVIKHGKKDQIQPRTAAMRTFSDGGGGGRKVKPLAGATDDDRPSSSSPTEQRHLHMTRESPPSSADASTSVNSVSLEEEAMAWKRMVEEATTMTAETRHGALMDEETLLRLVSPVTVVMDPDGVYPEYSDTDAMYQTAVKEDPHNSLFLSNYAQFLFQVVHDHERAEYYFKRAVEAEPSDAEALSRYAFFLWQAKKDLGAAEEVYLEAIAAEPGNMSHAANYAHFLWNTGGEDTCFPLDDYAEDV